MIDAKTIYELRPEDREKADRSFAQGHGSSPDFSLPSDRAWIEGYAYALATQAQPQEAAPKVPALPPSYVGSSLIGKPNGECAINFHFSNTEEAEKWFESVTEPQEAAPIDVSDRLLADLRILAKRGVLTEAAFRLIVSWAERYLEAAPSQDAEDAARYRAWRDNMITYNATFHHVVAAVLPAGVGASRRPTAQEWDAAIDAACAQAKEGGEHA